MKRDILTLRRDVSGCCPGHGVYPDDTYSSNRSKRARSRDIGKEHRYVRRKLKEQLVIDSRDEELE